MRAARPPRPAPGMVRILRVLRTGPRTRDELVRVLYSHTKKTTPLHAGLTARRLRALFDMDMVDQNGCESLRYSIAGHGAETLRAIDARRAESRESAA